jgi:hypothetical protein
MSYTQERIDIESRFNAQWAATTPVLYENTGQRPPAGTPFIELKIVGGNPSRSLGENPVHRGYGYIVINIFIPRGQGMKPGYLLADQAMAIYRDAKFNGISCYAPTPPIPLGEIEQWQGLSVSVPFYRDEIF